MSNFSGVEFVWTAFALWGFLRGLQLAVRHVTRRRLLTSSGQNGLLQVTAFIGAGRAVASVTIEGFFLLTGVLAALTPPRIPQPFQILNFIATYGILIGAGVLAAWHEAEVRLDTKLVSFQEQEALRIARSEQAAQTDERAAQSAERDEASQFRKDNAKP